MRWAMTSHVVRNSLTYWKIVDIFKKTSLSDIVGLATTSNFSFAVAPPPHTYPSRPPLPAQLFI